MKWIRVDKIKASCLKQGWEITGAHQIWWAPGNRNIKFCKQNTMEYCNADRTTWKLTLQDINTTPKELKTERDCSHRQLFRPLWGSSVCCNNQKLKIRLWWNNQFFSHIKIGPGGVLMGILGGGVPPGSPNPDPIWTKICHFPYSFLDLEVVTKRNITCLHVIKHKLCHHCNKKIS